MTTDADVLRQVVDLLSKRMDSIDAQIVGMQDVFMKSTDLTTKALVLVLDLVRDMPAVRGHLDALCDEATELRSHARYGLRYQGRRNPLKTRPRSWAFGTRSQP